MENTMKLAIETYSELTGRSIESVQQDLLNKNEIVTEIIMKLMFCVAEA
jgi:hypothetical protein